MYFLFLLFYYFIIILLDPLAKVIKKTKLNRCIILIQQLTKGIQLKVIREGFSKRLLGHSVLGQVFWFWIRSFSFGFKAFGINLGAFGMGLDAFNILGSRHLVLG